METRLKEEKGIRHYSSIVVLYRPIRDDPKWTFSKNSLKLIEQSNINKV